MAVTVDWVELTAGIIDLGVGNYEPILSNLDNFAQDIQDILDHQTGAIEEAGERQIERFGRNIDIDVLVANFGATNQLLVNQVGLESDFVVKDLSQGVAGSFAAALGDIDGDGDLDALIANDGTNQLLTNQGGIQGGTEGNLFAEDLKGGSHTSRDVALADLDGDGDLDAFIANVGPNQLLFNQGGAQNGEQGEFLSTDLLLGKSESTAVALGDIDGDGDIDALVANTAVENQLLINQGRAQGGTEGEFTASELDGGQQNSFDIALGDIDGDGDLDALLANILGPNQVLTNQGGIQLGTEGEFAATDLDMSAGDSTAVAFGDIDGDGDLDALIANIDLATQSGATNQLLVNQGGDQGGIEGEFLVSDLEGGENATLDIVLGDIDDDGDLDALLANFLGPNQVLTNQGGIQLGTEGEFAATDLEDGAFDTAALALGDIDGDGNAPSVDAFGFPNINLDGLLPDAPAPDLIA